MARVMKKFETEAEYQEWVNGPMMMTPYTCFVRQTGNVHYEEGRDDDYSITYVVRKDGWCEILPVAAKVKNYFTNYELEEVNPYNVNVYLNGELLSLTDRRLSSQASFYHRDKDYSDTANYVPESGDFADLAKCHNDMETNIKRGATGSAGVQMYFPKHRIGCRKDDIYTRFFWAKKDDIIKISADPEFFSIRTRIDHCKFAKEIIVGDGVRKINWMIGDNYKKIFFGKNIRYYDLWNKLSPKNERKSNFYTSKNFCPLITDHLALFLDAKNNLGASHDKNSKKWVDKINGIEFVPDTGVNSADRNKFYWGKDYVTVTSGLSSDSPVFRTQWNPNIGNGDFTIIMVYDDEDGGNQCPRGDYIFGTAGYGMSGANRWQVVFDNSIMFAHNVNNSWKYEFTLDYPPYHKNCIAIVKHHNSISMSKNGCILKFNGNCQSQTYGGTGGLSIRITNLKSHAYLMYNKALSDEDLKHMSIWATNYYKLK